MNYRAPRPTPPFLAVLLSGALLGSCAIGSPAPEPTETTTETLTATSGAGTTPEPTPPPHSPAPTPPPAGPSGATGGDADLATLVAEVTATYGGAAGVAVSDGASASTAGELTTGPAWSTIKVPISVAALRLDPSLTPVVQQAVSASDNDAAQQLWAALGTPEQAGMATQSVLAEGGDATVVNTAVTRPEFSSFGQTQWALADQAGFAARLPCLPGTGAEAVTAAMGAVTPGQDYGLGSLPGALFKGGWGPDESGGYLVRQFGMLPLPDGDHVAIAIAARPGSGSYEDGQAMLDRLAAGVGATAAAGELPAARC